MTIPFVERTKWGTMHFIIEKVSYIHTPLSITIAPSTLRHTLLHWNTMLTFHDTAWLSKHYAGATFTTMLAAHLQYNFTRLIEGEVTQCLHKGIGFSAYNCWSEHTIRRGNLWNPFKVYPTIPCWTSPPPLQELCKLESTVSYSILALLI